MIKKRNHFGSAKILNETSNKKKITCQHCNKEFLGDEYYQNRQACEYCLIRVKKVNRVRTLSESMKLHIQAESSKKRFERKEEKKIETENKFVSMLNKQKFPSSS